MKSKLIFSLGLLAAPAALLAKSPEDTYIETCRAQASAPVPTIVVSPQISPEFAGRQVVIEFVIDGAGVPTHIRSATAGAEAELVTSISDALTSWRFEPTFVDGKPKARKVWLPVNIVERRYDGFAVN